MAQLIQDIISTVYWNTAKNTQRALKIVLHQAKLEDNNNKTNI